MINLTIRMNDEGLLKECRSFGHAETGPAGADLVCASVTILLRSCARTLEGCEGVVVSGSAAKPGELVFTVESFTTKSREWLKGVGDYLLTGLSDLVQEYPEACGLKIIND